MEVFFHGLQPGCRENRLTDYLAHVFSEFGITTNEFICEKKKRGTRIATATILDQQKAENFLSRYGDRRGALNLGGPFSCTRSKHELDDYKLKSLMKRFMEAQKDTTINYSQPDSKSFLAKGISCGVWSHENGQLSLKRQWSSWNLTQILFGRKEVAFHQQFEPGSARDTRMVVEYSTIQSMASSVSIGNLLALTLDRPPKFYGPEPLPEEDLPSMLAMFKMSKPKFRRDEPKRPRVSALDHQHLRFVESCFVYQVELLPLQINLLKRLLKKDKRLPDLNTRHFGIELPSIKFDAEMAQLRQRLATSTLTFAVKFQLQKLAQSSYLLPQLITELMHPLLGLERKIGMEKLVYRLQQLSRHLPILSPDENPKHFEFTYIYEYLAVDVDDTEADVLSAFELSRNHPHLCVVHRARVTPGGIYLHGPYAEARNGVLQTYQQFALGHFLRVSFEDEQGEQLKYEQNVDLSQIHHIRFKGVLDLGIEIAGRKFEFLGFSHSSLREGSCWFLAPFVYEGLPMFSKSLITQLGDFSHVRSPAKCGARIGQAFTDLNDTVHIPLSAVDLVDDIERNGRCFSDGCSTASLEVFEKLWKHMRPGRLKPTTFQIRYGGVKGVITLDRSLEGLRMKIRNSQKKFPSGTEMLGICGAAKRSLPMFLNRPMIKILEDLGISTATFLQFQQTAVDELRMMTTSVPNAATFAEINDIGRAMSFSWLLRELHYLGISALEDKFLWSAIELLVILRVRDIKYKARIPIAPECGTTLFGIMDETNTLRPGEIFCTVDNGRIVTGNVAVTRSPAMHPGDIQPAMAVDVAEGHPLRSLHNVVVFSQQGERDLPSMLSGGDLDGDLFNVIFTPVLQPTSYQPPADYPRPQPIDLGRPIEPQDITDFFIKFMSNDQLGQIATKHLQMADQKELGTLDSDCILLAEMHSIAVDFSKTGIPVDMSQAPRLPSKCKPDFMASGPRMLIEHGVTTLQKEQGPGFYQKNEHDILHEADGFRPTALFYESPKALGRLYRQIDEFKLLQELQEAKVENVAKHQFALKQLWNHVQQKCQGWQWEHLESWAQGVKIQYNNHVEELMYQYALDPHRPLTELEVFLGTVMGKDGGIPSRRAREIASSMREHFEEAVHYTMGYILKGEEDDLVEEALERSLACFAVALQEDDTGYQDPRIGKLQSFAYLTATICLRQVQRSVVDGY